MGAKTKIEWTSDPVTKAPGATWNPVKGCTRVSEGCRNCYAERMAARFSKACGYPANGNIPEPFHGFATMTSTGPRWTGKVALDEKKLDLPLRWKKPRRIFVNSMSDLFHEGLPDKTIDQVFAVMALCPQHTFMVLTKRAQRMEHWFSRVTTERMINAIWATPSARSYLGGWPLPNVWLGVSVENQATADERIPLLLRIPAAVRFVSVEPMLGPVDLHQFVLQRNVEHRARPFTNSLDWVICGGESGPGARPMSAAWPRALRDQCVGAKVPFFLKQWGEYGIPSQMSESELENWDFEPDNEDRPHRVGKRAAGCLLDGREWKEYPK